jgi:tetratricopeptide (TPR) repeat protein/TolB-like protein
VAAGDEVHDTETGVDLARRLAPGTLVADRYRVLATAGTGGMGVVYRARDEELGVDVALKVLRPDLGHDPAWLSRFRRELVLARQVTHRNVVRIHDIGESSGLRFLTMRYVDGRSLLDVLRAEGTLPADRAARIVRQVADALQQAHDAKVVHRDLKPGNILLEADDTAYVTDFGVARSLDGEALTRRGAIVGTPAYLSPEQAAGEEVDARSDLYALGIVFYEMLTGELPFRGESQAEMLGQRLTGHVPSMSRRIPGWLRAVIRRCLERSPARRYQTARELADDLDRGRASRPARPRTRAAAAVAVLAAVAAAVGIAGRDRAAPAPSPAAVPAAAAPVAATHAVAILPLADDTAEAKLAWAGTGIAEMLAAGLAESPGLRVVDPQRVFRVLRDLGLAPGRLDERAQRLVAELLEVDRLVDGALRRAGDAVRVDLRVLSVPPSGPVASRPLGADAAGDAGLFAAVDRLGETLRRELGGTPPGNEAPLPETESLAAREAFQEARARLLVGDYLAAAPALERAAAADPGWAAALERLAETYQNLGYGEKARAAAERAADLAGASETRLGFRIRARLALLDGRPADAETSYAELVRRYPNDTEALLDLASAQSRRGDVARAVATLERAAEVDRTDPRVWFLLGRNTILMGDAARAVKDHLVRALALHGRLHNEQGQGEVLNAMGVAYHQLGDNAQAIEKYSQAAGIRRRLGDERGIATSLKNRARVHLATGRFAAAEPDLAEARRISERIGDKAGVAEALNDFGVLHEGRGDYPRARRAYQEALKLRRDLGDERQLAQSYDNVGYISFLEGEYDAALVYWRQALDLRRKAGEKTGVILSTQNLGFLHVAQGRWDDALKAFAEALEDARAIDYKAAVAVSLGNIGLLQQYQGRYAAALRSYGDALALLRGLGDTRGLAEFTLKRASALLELGRLEEAKAGLDEAGGWLAETGNREQSADHQALLGAWHARRGEMGASRAALARAAEEAQASGSRPARLRARVAAAETAAAAGQPPAPEILAPLLKEVEDLGDALLRIRAAEAMAGAQLARGRLPPAEDWARRALAGADRHGWNAGRYRLHSLLARVLHRRGDRAGAEREHAEGARRVAALRAELDEGSRSAFDALPAVRQASTPGGPR